MPDLLTAFGIVALTFVVSALFSQLVERAPISFPMIFLAIGFLLGEHGLGLLHIGLHDATLETVATLSLSFVLFLDALNMRVDEIRQNWLVPALSLGPGTLLTMALIALAAALVLHFPPVNALLLGAVLSSIDPVLLRDVISNEGIPRSIRDSLLTEAGAGDIIVLPVLLLLSVLALGQGESVVGWLGLLARLFLVGPLAGVVVGLVLTRLIQWVRARMPISRAYRALYGIGGLLASYYLGTRLGSSGFLSVFAAGLVTARFDDDLCDCFLEYGEITSEMLMLLAFLLFGALLSTMVASVALLPVAIFALITLVLARPIAVSLVLRRASLSRYARLFIGWFGPRGLSSLLFALLLVTMNVPGAEQILSVAGVVVIISVVLHGVTSIPLSSLYSRWVMQRTLPEERVGAAAGLFLPSVEDVPRISVDDLAAQLAGPNPPLVLDVRSRSSYNHEAGQIPGSLRVLPDFVTDWAKGKNKDRGIVTYCT